MGVSIFSYLHLHSQSIATHTKLWYLIDASDQVVGRLAVMISLILQGKTKPIYHPAGGLGSIDYKSVISFILKLIPVITWLSLIHARQCSLDESGTESCTGITLGERVKPYSLISIIVFSYPGGLKEIMAKDIHKKDPTRVRRREGREGSNDYCYQVLYKAVNGNLPKNTLRSKRMNRLHLFPDEVSNNFSSN